MVYWYDNVFFKSLFHIADLIFHTHIQKNGLINFDRIVNVMVFQAKLFFDETKSVLFGCLEINTQNLTQTLSFWFFAPFSQHKIEFHKYERTLEREPLHSIKVDMCFNRVLISHYSNWSLFFQMSEKKEKKLKNFSKRATVLAP